MQRPILTPDLDLGEAPITVSVWLAKRGAEVVAGDRVVELLAGDVVVDVSAPVGGVLIERQVGEDEAVRPGQSLGVILARDDD
ncbi:MAG: biotin attachment protein [Planctomycetes bacterium]|nr:biotin attachment protein [Planctomycetota bacterium]